MAGGLACDSCWVGCHDAVFGQDAHYRRAQLSFTNNWDGSITDDITGLEWTAQDDNSLKSWTEADQDCAALSLGGEGGWRLPSAKELLAVMRFTEEPPFLDASVFTNAKSKTYHTATSHPVSGEVMGIHIGEGTSSWSSTASPVALPADRSYPTPSSRTQAKVSG